MAKNDERCFVFKDQSEDRRGRFHKKEGAFFTLEKMRFGPWEISFGVQSFIVTNQ
jgi:hypothetical protein